MVDAICLGFDHQVGDVRRQARQRVDLQNVGLPIVGHVQAEIHARHVVSAGHAEDRRGQPVEFVHQIVVDGRRAQIVQFLGQRNLEVVAINRIGGFVRPQVHFHGRHEIQSGLHARGVGVEGHAAGHRSDQVADHTDRHLAPFDVGFHQSGLLVFLDDESYLLAQLGFAVHDGLGADAHAGAFAAGFDEQRKAQVLVERLIRPVEFLEGRGGQLVPPQDAFGHGLVQRQRQGEQARTGVGNAQHLQNRRHLGFARIAEVAFANIEADVGAEFRNGG